MLTLHVYVYVLLLSLITTYIILHTCIKEGVYVYLNWACSQGVRCLDLSLTTRVMSNGQTGPMS